jgi:serpin B
MESKKISDILCLFISSCLCLLLISCGGSGNSSADVDSIQDVAQSDKTREMSPDVSDGELNELVTGNTAFALDLYRYLSSDGGNLFFSPHSISLALAMTYAGARTETEQQMAQTLGFTLPQTRLHPAFNALALELTERGNSSEAEEGSGFKLNIANAIWGQSGYSFLSDFLDVLAVNYGAGMRLLDFYNSPEPSRETINLWVEDQTMGKIKDLIPPGSITGLTRIVLTNAIYFNAAWALPFDRELTHEGTFKSLDGGENMSQMMRKTNHFNYAGDEDYQAVELPYEGGELSMVVILPGEGRFRDFEGGLTPEKLAAVVDNFSTRNVTVTTPKFSFAPDAIRLSKTLSEMGMPVAFSYSADFSGIDGTRNLSISDVLHKAFIKVDEAGTEAAASTAVIIGITGMPPEPIEFTADHPFIYLIRDIKTGAILFIGRIVELNE